MRKVFRHALHEIVYGEYTIGHLGWLACDALVVADIAARHAVEWAHLSLPYLAVFTLTAAAMLVARVGGGGE